MGKTVQAAEPKVLLSYVEDLLGELEAVKAAQDADRAESNRVRIAIETTDVALTLRRRELAKPDRSRELAAAALRGEPLAPEPGDPPGQDPKVLEEALRGLRALKAEIDARIDAADVSMRTATARAFRTAAERAAADLVDAVRCVERLHAEIGAAQRFVESLGSEPGRAPEVLLGADWFELRIASSDGIAALRPHTRMNYGRPMLTGGDRDGLHKAATEAFETAKAEVRRRLGGYWPLDKRF